MKTPKTTLQALIWLPFVLFQILFMAFEPGPKEDSDGKAK